MALCCLRAWSALDDGHILAPERYHPRRSPHDRHDAIALGALVSVSKVSLKPRAAAACHQACVVLDTADVKEGVAQQKSYVRSQAALGSIKNWAPVGSVIISRLRPYLRQVAFVDAGVVAPGVGAHVQIACSSEFFVLTGLTSASIAFLAPWLLTAEVQEVLSAAQEGAHHPRFSQATLLGLWVPKAWVTHRESLSRQTEQALATLRAGRVALASVMPPSGGDAGRG